MKCPICKKNTSETQNTNIYMPFCSNRCKQVDLGNWFNEVYSIPKEELSEDELEVLSQLNHEDIKES